MVKNAFFSDTIECFWGLQVIITIKILLHNQCTSLPFMESKTMIVIGFIGVPHPFNFHYSILEPLFWPFKYGSDICKNKCFSFSLSACQLSQVVYYY
jgi:hypothetical protein